MTEAGVPLKADGRTARAERTRRAIVDAHLALLTEGELRPTGERIAERAGVSLRTLWSNFKDMEALFAASGAELYERQRPYHRRIDPGLPLHRRIEEFCRQRVEVLELIAPVARAAQIREPYSPALRQSHRRELDRVRDEIYQLFSPELDAAGSGGEQLLQAMVMSCTFASWSMLRDLEGLDTHRAHRVMRHALTALLSTAIAAGLGD